MSDLTDEAALKLMEQQTKYIKQLAENSKTLRDEFALAALKAVTEIDDFPDVETMAKSCYQIADAMLEVRKAKEE